MTGAPLPEGADCVLMQELTDGGEDAVRLYAALKPEENVVFRGGDIAAGAVIAAGRAPSSPRPTSGCAGGQGYAAVPVCKPLTVGVLSTGSELLAPGEAVDARQNLRRQRHPERRPAAAAGLQRPAAALLGRPGGDHRTDEGAAGGM